MNACSYSKSSFSDADRWIPADFNPQKGTLLVEKYPIEKTNEAMREYLDQHYPGKYVILDREAIFSKSGKYADARAYPFAFLWQMHYTERQSSAGSSFSYHNVDPNGHFYDRVTDKEYPTTRKYNNYGQRSYIPFINSIVQHYQK